MSRHQSETTTQDDAPAPEHSGLIWQPWATNMDIKFIADAVVRLLNEAYSGRSSDA